MGSWMGGGWMGGGWGSGGMLIWAAAAGLVGVLVVVLISKRSKR
jgi:hypothetical protein